MRYSSPLLAVLFSLTTATVGAWAPPADTLRPTSPERTIAYTYANDLFFRTDYYFTQGMSLTLVHPALAYSPVNYLLPGGPAGSTQHHGVALHYDGFTPLRIQDAFIRVGDRPYAAYGYASFFRVSTQPARRQRLTTALELGFIGPAAGGKELQTTIHRVTNNAEPRGWDYQIRNDAVLGYRVKYETLLLAAPGRAELLSSAAASLGTLYTNADAGLHLRAGRLTPCFATLGTAGAPHGAAPRWQLYGQAAVEGRLVGYDATLQGGVFTTDNPYTIAARDVRRAVLRSSGGVVLARGGFGLAATATWVSTEFAGGRSHRWGQLGATVAF